MCFTSETTLVLIGNTRWIAWFHVGGGAQRMRRALMTAAENLISATTHGLERHGPRLDGTAASEAVTGRADGDWE